MKAVFVDRDGTLGGSGGGVQPGEFTPYEQSPRAIRVLNQAKIPVFLFTNQSRVGRGYFTENQLLRGFQEMEKSLAKEGASLDGIYYCPHAPEQKCGCQKPEIGLLLRAKEEHELHLADSYVVGDTGASDMVAAHKAGMKKVLVKTGWGEGSLTTFRASWQEVEPDFIATDILQAVQWILEDMAHSELEK